MTIKNLEEKVKEILNRNYDIPLKKITQDVSLKNLGLDSLDIAEFYLRIENEIGSDMGDEEMQCINTFGECIDYIKKHTKNLKLIN